MKPGQRLSRWWQEYGLGRLLTPQAIMAAVRADDDAPSSADRFFSMPEDHEHWDVPQRLRARSFLLSEAHLRQWDRANWAGVDPRVMRFAALMVEMARKRDIPLYVHCALRNKAEQDAAFAAGHSKLRWPDGAHNWGAAVDIVHGVFHWDLTPQEWRFMEFLGRRAERRLNATLSKDRQLSFVWGGNWSSLYDPAHWQVANYRTYYGSPVETDGVVRRTPRSILRLGLGGS